MLIIFDLDDTLVDTAKVAREYKTKDAINAMITAGLKLPFGNDDALKQLREIDSTAPTGSEAIKIFLSTIKFEKNTDKDKFALIAEKAYYGNLDKNTYSALPGAVELLQSLQGQHTLVIVSKGEEKLQYHKMATAGIATSLFRKIVVISIYDKKTAYQEVLKHFQISPVKAIVVGDKFDLDLMPAALLGMKTIHIQWGRGKHDEKGKKMATASVRSLNEILDVLAKIEKGAL
ncbi:HAD family hydrolase [Candidatus Woesearchaeota archaeon]|nr:HAD family hydrolase [Candidatus Woesearchaeota archaeon]